MIQYRTSVFTKELIELTLGLSDALKIALITFFRYLIRTNFRGHLISRIWNTNISRALIFAILQKLMTNLGHLISRKLTKDRLRKPGAFFLLIDHLNND